MGNIFLVVFGLVYSLILNILPERSIYARISGWLLAVVCGMGLLSLIFDVDSDSIVINLWR